MRPYTHKFTRDALLECAKRELARRQADEFNVSPMECDEMEAIVLVLESYPLASIAGQAVSLIFADLKERGGFRDLFDSIELPQLQKTITAKLANTVVYQAPIATPQTQELEFA